MSFSTSPFHEDWQEANLISISDPRKIEIFPHEVQAAIGNAPAMCDMSSRECTKIVTAKRNLSRTRKVKAARAYIKNTKEDLTGTLFYAHSASVLDYQHNYSKIPLEKIGSGHQFSDFLLLGWEQAIAQNALKAKQKKKKQVAKRATTHWAVSPFDPAFDKLCTLPRSRPKSSKPRNL